MKRKTRNLLFVLMLVVACAFMTISVSAAEQQSNTSVLNGKSIMFLGDSLTSGHELDSYSDSWSALLGTEYGMSVTNNSIAGSTFAKAAGVAGNSWYDYKPGGCRYPMCERSLPSGQFDIIFVESGGNDAYCCIPFAGDVSSRNVYTFEGAINVIFDRLQETYPNALILAMTNWEPVDGSVNANGDDADVYNDVLLSVCAYRDIPCFEARDRNISGIKPNDPAFRQKYFTQPDDYYHLNPAGHRLYLPVIANWIGQELTQFESKQAAEKPQTGWYTNNGSVYYYENGNPVTGVRKIDDKTYYFTNTGIRYTGWVKYYGYWYYFNPSTGARAEGWQSINGYKYYFDSEGRMVTGFQKINGKTYYFASSGYMTTGWVKVNNAWYYMNANGEMQTGWVKSSGYWYYLNSSGKMVTGWQYIGGSWYWFNSSGAMRTGWLYTNSHWYYLNSSGQMVTGWQYIGGYWYYFYSSGALR